jgi:subtilase family serine protease
VAIESNCAHIKQSCIVSERTSLLVFTCPCLEAKLNPLFRRWSNHENSFFQLSILEVFEAVNLFFKLNFLVVRLSFVAMRITERIFGAILCLFFGCAVSREHFKRSFGDIFNKYESFKDRMDQAGLIPDYVVKGKFNLDERTHVLMETTDFRKRKDISKRHRAARGTNHTLVFFRKHHNLDQLQNMVQEISNPLSDLYGRYLTRDEVNEITMTDASKGEYALLPYLNALKENGRLSFSIIKRSPLDEFVTVQAPVEEWELLLSAQFFEFEVSTAEESTSTGASSGTDSFTRAPGPRFVRAESYSLPATLAAHVGAVFNTVQIPDMRRTVVVRDSSKISKSSTSRSDSSGGSSGSTRVENSSSRIDRSTSSGSSSSSGSNKGGESLPVKHQLHHRRYTQALDTATTVSTRAASGTYPSAADATPVAGQEEQTVGDAAGSTTSTSTVGPLSTIGELSKYVTPALLNRVYGIPSNDGGQRGSQGVYETIDQAFSPADLKVFQQRFGLPVESVAQDIGGHMNNNACKANNGNDCIEANLDVQYIMAVANHVPTTYYYWAGDDFLLEWAMAVSEMAHPPLVLSISYGIDEDYLPASYGAQFDVQAMKLAVMGVTLLASSGDDGAVGGSAGNSPMYCGYAPSFPATSPYVTAVGGTMVLFPHPFFIFSVVTTYYLYVVLYNNCLFVCLRRGPRTARAKAPVAATTAASSPRAAGSQPYTAVPSGSGPKYRAS